MKPARTTELLYTASSGETRTRTPSLSRRSRFRDGLQHLYARLSIVTACLQAGSNRRPLPFQGSALPTELQRHWCGAWLRYNHISRFARVSSLRWFLCSLCAPCCTIFAASTLYQPHRACRGGRTHMSCWTPRFKLGAYAVPPGRRCFAAYPSPDSNREHTRSKRAASARLG